MRRARIAALLVPPALAGSALAGCGVTSGTTATPSPSVSSTAPWLGLSTGNPSPSPSPSVSFTSPAPFPTGFLPSSTVTATATPTVSGTCDTGNFEPGQINGVTVVPTATSATVTWFNPGGNDLVEYRLTAISQNLVPGIQRDVGWTVITPGTSCAMMSAALTGLDSKTNYVFSVDAVFIRQDKDGTSAATVARSRPIATL